LLISGPEQSVDIDVHGCEFRLTGRGSPAFENLVDDFRFFVCAHAENPLTVELVTEHPPYDAVPNRTATIYTPRNVSFTLGGDTYIDYGGRALAIWHRDRQLFQIYTQDPDIQYEAGYLFLLSRIGEYLDNRHMHRIHAMAMSVNDRAVLAIMPMGGGKSTLCSALWKYPEYHMLSDDSPFISADGRVHAFPLRLGLLPGSASDIPVEYQRTIRRMEFGPKLLISYEYFRARVKPSATPGIVFLGRRTMAAECCIEPAGAWEQFKFITANCVVGLGLFQGVEFVLTHSPLQLASKASVVWSRMRVARKLFSLSQVYRLILGRDQELNAATIRSFVADRLAGN